MFYWKYSSTRTFYLNEYWIFIPIAIAGNYFLLRKVNDYRDKKKQLELLKQQLEHEQRIRRILMVGFGLSSGLSAGLSVHLAIKGGATSLPLDLNRVSDRCFIERGIRYLDNDRLRSIIHNAYSSKRKGQIIYITASALCHVASGYGQRNLSIPIAVGDIGITSLYQAGRKLLAVTAGGFSILLFIIGGRAAIAAGSLLGTFGLQLGLNNRETILTSPVDERLLLKDIPPRMPDVDDVVVVNLQGNDKVYLKPEPHRECWMPGQLGLNPNCKTLNTPEVITLTGLEYDDVVNIVDTSGVEQLRFADESDFGRALIKPEYSNTLNMKSVDQVESLTNQFSSVETQTQPLETADGIDSSQFKTNSRSNSIQGKQINFLEKFGDPKSVDEDKAWNIDENALPVPEQPVSKIKNDL